MWEETIQEKILVEINTLTGEKGTQCIMELVENFQDTNLFSNVSVIPADQFCWIVACAIGWGIREDQIRPKCRSGRFLFSTFAP